MRSSLTVWLLSVAAPQLTQAMGLGGARQVQLQLMADMGILPDTIHASGQKSFKTFAAGPPPPNDTIVPEYVELPLNHFANTSESSSDGTFFNRFWVSQSAYKPGAPVFLYDVGEANAESGALFRLTNETSFFKQIVDKYNGIGIVWEHRYYGNSTPKPINLETPPEVFRWLTTEQSLADVDRFAKQFKRSNISYDLTPSNTPWVFVGGSYPAMRAAFMRQHYPDTIFASYASSAPTEAQNDMSVYFEPIWRGMERYGFGNCTRDIQAAIRYIDTAIENPTVASNMKEQFLGKGAGNNSNPTFADALSTPFYNWQGGGVEGGALGLRKFCDWIETDPATNKTSPAEGWAASKGANFTVQRWSKYKDFVTMVNTYMETDCSGKQNVTGDCNLDLRFTDPDSISWTWQYCTQWGFFQSANLGDHQLVSKYNSLEHQKDICHRQFPTAKAPLFPDWPRDNQTNESLGGWNIRPAQTYWSGGEFDPWRTLSPLSDINNGSPHPKAFTDPPDCGKGQSVDQIFGYVIPNAQHCYDFRTTFAGGEISRKYFTNALDKWFKCFKPKGGSYHVPPTPKRVPFRGGILP